MMATSLADTTIRALSASPHNIKENGDMASVGYARGVDAGIVDHLKRNALITRSVGLAPSGALSGSAF
jgi:hypothetical protein